MERAAVKVVNPAVMPFFFLQAADFIKNFADGCHNVKEEVILFSIMVAAGVPVEGGVIGVMRAEHEQGRQFTRAMQIAAEHWLKGNAVVIPSVVSNALGYVRLLRQHIDKENTMLFPLADQLIPYNKQIAMGDEFERIQREETLTGIHETYQALIETLEQEAAAF
jgi:hemerythrin-like domain-containing protein